MTTECHKTNTKCWKTTTNNENVQQSTKQLKSDNNSHKDTKQLQSCEKWSQSCVKHPQSSVNDFNNSFLCGVAEVLGALFNTSCCQCGADGRWLHECMIYDTSTTKNNIVNVLNMSVAHLEVLSGFFQDLYSIGADHLYSTEKLQFTETSVVFVFNNSNNKNFT